MVFNMCPAIFYAKNPSRNKGMSHKHWTTTISTEPTINTALVLHYSTHDFASTTYMQNWLKELCLAISLISPLSFLNNLTLCIEPLE